MYAKIRINGDILVKPVCILEEVSMAATEQLDSPIK